MRREKRSDGNAILTGRAIAGVAVPVPALLLFACLAVGQERGERPEVPRETSGGTTEREEGEADGTSRSTDFRAVLRDTPVTRAVDHALRYLEDEQREDGSWWSRGFDANTGIVGLAVMAFLARGHEPGRGIYGDVIDRGIAWILESRNGELLHRKTSRIHGSMYSHGIAALLLGEVIGMVDEDRARFAKLSRVHRDAVELILRAQRLPKNRWNAGGWRYTPEALNSDLSVSGWQLLALRAAQEAGLPVPKESIDLAVTYVLQCARPDGAFSYQPNSDVTTVGLTGTGILTLEICGRHGSKEAKRGGEWLLRNPLEWNQEWFYYGVYYGSQAMYQLGEKYWEAYQPIVRTILLEKQNEDGSWPFPPAAVAEEPAGEVYATALAVLALSVEFRYLPIYQR